MFFSVFTNIRRHTISTICSLLYISVLTFVVLSISNVQFSDPQINATPYYITEARGLQSSYFSEDIIEQLAQIDTGEDIIPQLQTKTIVNGYNITFIGVEVSYIYRITRLEAGDTHTFDSEPTVVVGNTIAKRAHLSIGDRIPLQSMHFRVSAIMAYTNTPADLDVYAFMGTTQKALHKEGYINRLLILPNTHVLNVVKYINLHYPELTIQYPTYNNAISNTVSNRGLAVYSMILGVPLLLLSILTSISYRTKEFHILRITKFRTTHVIQQIIIEYGIIVTTGIICGYGLFIIVSHLYPTLLQVS